MSWQISKRNGSDLFIFEAKYCTIEASPPIWGLNTFWRVTLYENNGNNGITVWPIHHADEKFSKALIECISTYISSLEEIELNLMNRIVFYVAYTSKPREDNEIYVKLPIEETQTDLLHNADRMASAHRLLINDELFA